MKRYLWDMSGLKKYILILSACSVLIPNLVNAQIATFETDTSRISNIPEMKWTINGKEMHFGSGVLQVPTAMETFDTLLLKQRPNQGTDTIIFNVNKERDFTLVYNECCGAFNINPKGSRTYIKGKLMFNLVNFDSSAQYFATLGEAGMAINPHRKDTLKVGCRSAMSPNIYPIALYKISPCKDSICDITTCVFSPNLEPNYGFGVTVLETYFMFLWMPLKSEPTTITYDLSEHKLISID